ncbi:MAG: hypothetical protein DDT40_01357 [candidate division WS2 bacterium]|nr:hypothetical protein [Candidatus Psychracetigena formicireducens]
MAMAISKVSILLMASQPETLPVALYGIRTAIADYHELLVGFAPDMPRAALQEIRAMPRARILPGTNDPARAGEVRFALMDAATGDWIANADDDDLWIYFPWDELAEERGAGYIHGDSVFFGEVQAGPWYPGKFELLCGGEITSPARANRAAGSQWIVRTDAWREVSGDIARYWDFSDFRLIAHLLRRGIACRYVPRTFGIVRVRKWTYPTETWLEHLDRIEWKT